MNEYQEQSVFGDASNSSQLLQGEWNPASSEVDIGRVIADGIVGTVQKAMNAAVGDKYQSGQLTATGTTAKRNDQAAWMNMLLVGALIYLVAKA